MIRRWLRRRRLRRREAQIRAEVERLHVAYITGTGQKLYVVHDPAQCEGRGCVIHHPSDHHMQDWPTNWRDGGMFDIKPPHMERICEHGIGHPDPDDCAFLGEDVIGVHGCDGCCRPPDVEWTGNVKVTLGDASGALSGTYLEDDVTWTNLSEPVTLTAVVQEDGSYTWVDGCGCRWHAECWDCMEERMKKRKAEQ